MAIDPAAPAESVPRSLSFPRAIARLEGKPVAGATVTLQGRESVGENLRFRWVQTSGPDVLPSDATKPDIRVMLPREGQPVEFLLIAASDLGMDTARLAVLDTTAMAGAQPREVPQADAGDDQLAVAGSQVTLNGNRSEPRGKIGFRWVQVSGPKVRLKLEEGSFFSFVPSIPGFYRFALVVGCGQQLSQPDEVSVTVGAVASASAASAAAEMAADPDSIDQLARRSLAFIHPKAETVERLAAAFDDIAGRMDLYEDYASMFRELSQRLESIIPATTSQRNLWMERVFNPLTMALIRALQEESLDLSRPEGQSVLLNAGQRARLAEQFRLIAEGFRAAGPSARKSPKLPLITPAGSDPGPVQGR